MELEKIEATIEAVLFALGDAVGVDKLAAAIGHDQETTRKIVHQMMDRYNSREGGMEIIELENAFQMATRREHYEALIKVAKQPKKYVLTDVQLEVLSIVAYKQPVTRQEVEKIRGVNSDHALNRLVEYGLIGEAGRLDAPGRPILFGTTEEFLRNFGVRSAEELPSIQPELVEEMKTQAEEEVQLKLNL
ncbi:MAG: SMC-Scp complex subunit ScpB [Lachnospiraceae bacterium]|nr:SMC-Scp complex subunit ScpB [Lachnospiraceae bacterium]MCI9658178.1 SMC-Scp complex subunit ScpB [Lachnospiraceae bacterium]